MKKFERKVRRIAAAGKAAAAVGVAFALLGTSAAASLMSSYQFNGKGNWSLDGIGGNTTPVGDIAALVPVGSTVEKAFLYSSLHSFTGPLVNPTVVFDGTVYGAAEFSSLGSFSPDSMLTLGAYRADVTAQVAAKIGSGAAVPFSFSIDSESPNVNIDGEVLAIVYSNPGEKERTIGFLDGFSATTGDSAVINLQDPLTSGQLADPDFRALLSLGIGYGFQGPEQASQVDVNGQRLTSSAGGEDDGVTENGGLITVGGIGDSDSNPLDPNQGANGNPRYDDEYYSLLPFLLAGDSEITVDTLNPSNDDNIFFLGLNITAVADIDKPPPGQTPVPAPLALLGVGLVVMRFVRRR